MFKKIVLPNGLRILTSPMKGTNTVTTLVMVGTGSDYENSKNNGISHFLEHMFFKGTKNRPKPLDVLRELDSIGSISNAFTSHEFTGYFIKAGKTFLDSSLDLLSDIYKNSLLKEEEVDRERQVIKEEIHRHNDTPTIYIWRIWERLLYGNQPAGWETLGPEKVLDSLMRKDFIHYFNTHYVSTNTAVIVAGSFGEDETIEKIKKYFSGIRTAKTGSPPPLLGGQKRPKLEIEYKETDQSHIIVGFHGLPAAHKDVFAMRLLAVITGGFWSARMFETIREKLGLAYNVRSSDESFSNRGYFVTYAGVDHSNAKKAIAAILKEYRKLADRGISQRELKLARNYVRGTSLIGMEASDAVADFIGIEEIVTGRPLTVEEVFSKIDKVTVEDVNRVAKKIFTERGLNMAVIGPYKEQKEFEKLLKL
ncbi:MAG: hypothetical protein A2934_02890 [Candidatus Sungbacteria bacterium RIFCSPLOWO2_01_FULL_47_10]|uniref:Peptidase M16 n=1 Tax=Candidatus Sungbacteria bacterium RIFCSPLOWO2_01_FULL_47_10 TaxID=1802276 RepID=A0A1G2L835_9BACT|nr:MAG: hypothetical protein A2934_02890 [Candidatus Sungbacteria bacterium RIFCSPLOWO2_01_FULL_47_10]